ncbi:MAG: hypothetical protein ACI9HK_002406 [Pirellulaceae bacterium]|jgi:hypothetical protein
MKSFSSSILIDATPLRIWGILTELDRWPTWNTTVDKVDGTLLPWVTRSLCTPKQAPVVRSH